MGKCPPVTPVTSQATSVITSRKLSQGLPHFDHHESVIKNGKAIMQAANGGEGDLKGSLVRNLLTSKVSLAMKTPHKANVSDSNASEHERSVIKDLLLKPRDSPNAGELWRSSPKSPTGVPTAGPTNGNSGNVAVSSHSDQELSSLYYVCTICKIAFRTKDTLEAHALHYCKSHHHHLTSHNNFEHNSEVQRKVSVMQSIPSASVLQRRLTEGRSQLSTESTRNSLGNILKKTLEGRERKISEPVLPSRFSSEVRMGPRKHSIFGSHYVQSPLSKTVQSTTFSTSTVTSASTVQQENAEDSFTKQVSAMLERKMSKDRSALPPLHDLSLESNSSSSCISFTTSSMNTGTSTIVLVPFSGKPMVEPTTTESTISLDILPDYLPFLKPSQTKITVKGPLLFSVLKKKIISEDKDLVEFQVRDPSEIGVNGLFDVNTISSGNKGDNSIELTKHSCNSSMPVMQVTSMPCREEVAMEAMAMDDVEMEEQAKSNGREEEKDEKENLNENSSHNREATSGSFDGNSTCNSLNMENNNNNNININNSSSNCNGLEKKVIMQVGKDLSVDQREIGLDQPECKESPRTRPSSLALRPTAFGQLYRSNILSPETPRTEKKFTQLFHNGHAYTYIGLKVSTRSTYCCIYRPQPMFVAQETEPRLSMYSNWQPSKPHDSLLQEITPRSLLSAYDMKQSTHGYVSSPTTSRMQVTSSQYWLTRSKAPAEEEESRKRKFPVTGLHAGEDTSRKISNCEVSNCTLNRTLFFPLEAQSSGANSSHFFF